MKTVKLDLHTHTNCSDGADTPSEVVEKAYNEGLDIVAITDHDTVSGLKEGRDTARKLGMGFVAGIEISCKFQGIGMHILGLNLDWGKMHKMEDFCQKLFDKRQERVYKYVEALNKEKNPNPLYSYDEVKKFATGIPGSPHIVKMLMNREQSTDINRSEELYAYLRVLSKKYNIDQGINVDAQQAIDIIHNTGGRAYLAHPGQIEYRNKKTSEEVFKIIQDLKLIGLDGVEAHYSTHSEEQTKKYSQYAIQLNLDITGGSDYHGKNKPNLLDQARYRERT